MKPVISFITLIVSDLQRASGFYHALGFPVSGSAAGHEDHVLFSLENNFSLVLYDRATYMELSGKAGHEITPGGIILSHITGSKEEVDAVMEQAIRAGGKRVGQAQDETWGYSANFTDPDGYQWEVTCMYPR